VVKGVEFESGTALLTAAAGQQLDSLAASLAQHPAIVVEIGAYTEAFDNPDTALRIARDRAIAVARYLKGQGIPVSRLRARAFGNSQPRASSDSTASQPLQNRIELTVLP